MPAAIILDVLSDHKLSFSIFLFNISITIFLLPRHQRRALTTRNRNVLVGGATRCWARGNVLVCTEGSRLTNKEK
jgi:hypothetical protein